MDPLSWHTRCDEHLGRRRGTRGDRDGGAAGSCRASDRRRLGSRSHPRSRVAVPVRRAVPGSRGRGARRRAGADRGSRRRDPRDRRADRRRRGVPFRAVGGPPVGGLGARRPRARASGRCPAARDPSPADVPRRRRRARPHPGMRDGGDGRRRRGVHDRRADRRRPDGAAVPPGRREAPPVSRRRRLRLELPHRDRRDRRGAVPARRRARPARRDAPAAAREPGQRGTSGRRSRAHRTGRARRRRHDRAQPRGAPRVGAGRGRARTSSSVARRWHSASSAGRLPDERRAAVDEVLARWS